MGWAKIIFGMIFTILVVSLLVFYWFIPRGSIDFGMKSGNSNFSISSEYEEMQFYKNMRFPTSQISYKILDCPLQKEDEMEHAFDIISELSVLDFYSVENDEEISVTCDSKTKMEEGLFIAGEGGPTNITQAGEFNVIFHGSILLIRESKCERPNIAIHELLHVLGFEHSSNPNNIMYYLSRCHQVIGEDTIGLINEIYSYPSHPDLVFENVSAQMQGRFLDVNISVRNNGLKNADMAKIIIYADEKKIKEIELESLQIGYGRKMVLGNVWIPQIVVNEIEFYIDYDGEELDKENNKIKLEIK
ncbi:matrixin family metalloprotease [Candidatus Pacearchaeota archaeon]|nr:matrixin family metalloprotease [Candidatus Pacearchaeota archaeon]